MVFRERKAAAETTLTLSCDQKAKFSKLAFQIEYDYLAETDNTVTVEIHTADGYQPQIGLSAPDLRGKKDGCGTFVRIFNPGDKVTVLADKLYGRLKFQGWFDEKDKKLAPDPSAKESVVLSPVKRNRVLTAIYK